MTPPDGPVLDAIAELLSPLLGALERIGWVQRHLYPPLAMKLAETLAPHADALAAPLAALEGLACPEDLGETELRNIDEPVRVFRLRPPPEEASARAVPAAGRRD